MMTHIEDLARRWHERSDHAHDGELFGGPMCNCLSVARRITFMLAEATGDTSAHWRIRAEQAERERDAAIARAEEAEHYRRSAETRAAIAGRELAEANDALQRIQDDLQEQQTNAKQADHE